MQDSTEIDSVTWKLVFDHWRRSVLHQSLLALPGLGAGFWIYAGLVKEDALKDQWYALVAFVVVGGAVSSLVGLVVWYVAALRKERDQAREILQAIEDREDEAVLERLRGSYSGINVVLSDAAALQQFGPLMRNGITDNALKVRIAEMIGIKYFPGGSNDQGEEKRVLELYTYITGVLYHAGAANHVSFGGSRVAFGLRLTPPGSRVLDALDGKAEPTKRTEAPEDPNA